jgi:Flp pilus assembly protein TadD
MQRSLVRIAALALVASALSACSLFGGGSDTDALSGPASHDSASVTADVNLSVHQAQLLRNSGDVQGATRILSQLMLTTPDDPGVVGEYGKLLVQEGRANDAVQFLRRAVELSPNDWSVYSALGVAYDQQGDQPDAKIAYEHALSLKPGEAAVLNNYAMSRMLAGDTVAAHALMAKAQASGSTDPKIARNLALLESVSPAKPAAPAQQAATVTAPPATHPAVVASAIPTVVVTGKVAPVSAVPVAHNAPTPITRGGTRVVMQEVPADALAGPRPVHKVKPVKVAKATQAPQNVALNTPKPVKKTKPAADQIPALRMTADATKP